MNQDMSSFFSGRKNICKVTVSSIEMGGICSQPTVSTALTKWTGSDVGLHLFFRGGQWIVFVKRRPGQPPYPRLSRSSASMLVMHVERPLVEEPFIPKKGNDPPEVPYQGFSMGESVGKFRHMMISKSPVTEISIIVNPVKYRGKEQNAKRADP